MNRKSSKRTTTSKPLVIFARRDKDYPFPSAIVLARGKEKSCYIRCKYAFCNKRGILDKCPVNKSHPIVAKVKTKGREPGTYVHW